MIARGRKMGGLRRKQHEGVGETAATHCEMVARFVRATSVVCVRAGSYRDPWSSESEPVQLIYLNAKDAKAPCEYPPAGGPATNESRRWR